MKHLLIASTVCLSALILLSGFTNQEADLSNQILEKSHAELEALSDLSTQFTYQIESPNLREPIAKTGSLKYKKGMYQIELPGQKIYCDTETLWIYLEEDNEVSIMEYDPDDAFSAESIFQIYETSSKTRYDGEETIHGVKCHKIYMAIQDSDLDYNQANVWINKKTSLLEKLSVTNRNQSTTTYEFLGVKVNSGYSMKEFALDVSKLPAGVMVYDER